MLGGTVSTDGNKKRRVSPRSRKEFIISHLSSTKWVMPQEAVQTVVPTLTATRVKPAMSKRASASSRMETPMALPTGAVTTLPDSVFQHVPSMAIAPRALHVKRTWAFVHRKTKMP